MAERFSVTHQRGFTGAAIAVYVFLYLPLLITIVLAFNAGAKSSDWQGFSLRWFQSAAQNQQVIDSSILSFKLAALAATLSTAAATLVALATTRTGRFAGWTLIYATISVPLMVPEIVTAVALLIVVATLRAWTGYAGLGYLVLAHTAFCVPFAYLPIKARLESMDKTLERAASDLYAPPLRVFAHVTLPLMWPGVLSGFILAFITSLDDVVTTEFVKSAGQDTLPTYMLGQIRRAVTPETNAVAAFFVVLAVVVVVGIHLLSKKRAAT